MAFSRAVLQQIAEGYRQDYADYRDAVLSGARIASRAERLKVERQERELSEGVDGYVFDWNAAVRPLVWIACNLRFPLGQKRGRRCFLAPHQVWDIMVLFGWVHAVTGERRFMLAYMEVARKNGKSTLAGTLSDYCAFGDLNPATGKTVSGVDCFVAATSLDQAEETFKRAGDSLALGNHKGLKISNSKNNKVIEWNGSRIRAISAAPKDGKLAYFTVLDEYHQHKTNELKDSILSGNVSDQQSLLLMITTAGTEIESVCHAEYEKCIRILEQLEDGTHYFVSIYEADQGDLPGDESTWHKANPNLGESVSLNAFRGIYENARPSETDMITFKTKNLNMWCRGTSRFINMPVFEEKCRWYVDPEELKGQECYCGLDLSSVYDFTAFTMDFPTPQGHVLISHFWVAENQVESIARTCRIPLRQWIADGHVTATPGDVIDYQMVCDYLQEMYDTYAIKRIAVDRWHIDRIEAILPPWFTEVEIEFSQYMKTMSQALTKFERAYLQGELTCNASPVMDWMMACCEAKQDGAGNQKIVKPNRTNGRANARIDGVITSIMAYDTADTQYGHEEAPVDPSAWAFF